MCEKESNERNEGRMHKMKKEQGVNCHSVIQSVSQSVSRSPAASS